MTSSARPTFSWSDAWLLHAIVLASAQHPATLREIIGMGDAIEKSIFSFEELSSGLAKLQAGGYIHPIRDGFEADRQVAEGLKSAGTKNDREARAWFAHLLGAAPWSDQAEREEPGPTWRYQGLTAEAVAKSFGEYEAEMAEILKKLGLSGA